MTKKRIYPKRILDGIKLLWRCDIDFKWVFCVFVLYSLVLAYCAIGNIVFYVLFYGDWCSCVLQVMFWYAYVMYKPLSNDIALNKT